MFLKLTELLDKKHSIYMGMYEFYLHFYIRLFIECCIRDLHLHKDVTNTKNILMLMVT